MARTDEVSGQLESGKHYRIPRTTYMSVTGFTLDIRQDVTGYL